jgi:hypothetical protein
MYLYHILFTLINICGIDCQKKKGLSSPRRSTHPLLATTMTSGLIPK